jgi:hypothetical protein
MEYLTQLLIGTPGTPGSINDAEYKSTNVELNYADNE